MLTLNMLLLLATHIQYKLPGSSMQHVVTCTMSHVLKLSMECMATHGHIVLNIHAWVYIITYNMFIEFVHSDYV